MHQKMHRNVLFLTSLIYLTHLNATKVVHFDSEKSDSKSEKSIYLSPADIVNSRPVLNYKDQEKSIKAFIGSGKKSAVSAFELTDDHAIFKSAYEEIINKLPSDKSFEEESNQVKNSEQLCYLLLTLGGINTNRYPDNFANRIQSSLNNIFLAITSNNYLVFNSDSGILSLASENILTSAPKFIPCYKNGQIFLMHTDQFHAQSKTISLPYKDIHENSLKPGVKQVGKNSTDCDLFAYWSLLRLMTLMPSIGEELSIQEFLSDKMLTIYHDRIVIADPNAFKDTADDSSSDNSILAMKCNEVPILYKYSDNDQSTYAQLKKVFLHKVKYDKRFFISDNGQMVPCKLVHPELNVEFINSAADQRSFVLLNEENLSCKFIHSPLTIPTTESLIAYIMMQYSGLVASSKNSTQSQVANLFLTDNGDRQYIKQLEFEFDANKFVDSAKELLESIHHISTGGSAPTHFTDKDQEEILETVKQYISYLEKA